MKRIGIVFIVLIAILSFSACEKVSPSELYQGEKRSYTEMIDGQGNIMNRWYYKYFSDGEISTSMRCTEKGDCLQRNEYTYGDNGLVATETIYLTGKKSSYIEYKYDEDNLLLTEKKFLPDSVTVTTYYYNNKKLLDYTETKDLNGNLIEKKSYTYDSSANLIEENMFNAANSIVGAIKYTYSEGSLPDQKIYEGTSSLEFSKEVYSYEGENLVKTLLYDKAGNLKYTDTAEFDGDKPLNRLRVDNNNNIIYTWYAYYDSFLSLIG